GYSLRLSQSAGPSMTSAAVRRRVLPSIGSLLGALTRRISIIVFTSAAANSCSQTVSGDGMQGCSPSDFLHDINFALVCSTDGYLEKLESGIWRDSSFPTVAELRRQCDESRSKLSRSHFTSGELAIMAELDPDKVVSFDCPGGVYRARLGFSKGP